MDPNEVTLKKLELGCCISHHKWYTKLIVFGCTLGMVLSPERVTTRIGICLVKDSKKKNINLASWQPGRDPHIENGRL